MGFDIFRFVVAPARKWRVATGFGDTFRPSDDSADTDLEHSGGAAAGHARFHGADHAFAKIERIGGWHSMLLTWWSGKAARSAPIPARPGTRLNQIGNRSKTDFDGL